MLEAMHSAAANAGSTSEGILSRLRAESRLEHEAVERDLDLMSAGLTVAVYRRRLEQLHGFYAPLEDRLEALGAFSGAEPEPLAKAALLAADLRALGVAEPERLPRCQALPDLLGPAQALGCLYVIEGATLGGQVIARHLHRTLGLEPQSGARFFHGYGEETGPRWRSFGARLVAFAVNAPREDLMVRAAIETFRALRAWCKG
jgi:heme oxygenase